MFSELKGGFVVKSPRDPLTEHCSVMTWGDVRVAETKNSIKKTRFNMKIMHHRANPYVSSANGAESVEVATQPQAKPQAVGASSACHRAVEDVVYSQIDFRKGWSAV